MDGTSGPDQAQAANAEGVRALLRGDPRSAIPHLQRALEVAPDWDVARYHLAQAFLSLGNYELGWPLHEARLTIPPLAEPTRPLPFPEWRGQNLQGRRIIVFGEQGLGDQIMFARYLPALRERGAEVTFGCAPEIAPLFPGAVSSISTRIVADYWTRLGSLPLHLRLGSIPPPIALNVLPGSGGGVGVAPTGNPTHWNDAHRSLPPGPAGRLLALGRDLRPEATGARNFLETAQIIASLDLVISVDTAMAHLAASMGKPTWILLPARGTDWRWMVGRENSPWYPSARLFRQAAPSVWSDVIDRIERDLYSCRNTARPSGSPP
jgi:hypothetical protein